MRVSIALALLWASTACAFASDTMVSELPPEARRTLALIKTGGPFPYPQDGKTFQNREKRLPQRQRGYYREYTVKTPGARDRGARRIVGGGCSELACVEYFYTEDHYRSFRRIIE